MVLQEVKECSRKKKQNGFAKILHKKHTFTLIVPNFVWEQLKNYIRSVNTVGYKMKIFHIEEFDDNWIWQLIRQVQTNFENF